MSVNMVHLRVEEAGRRLQAGNKLSQSACRKPVRREQKSPRRSLQAPELRGQALQKKSLQGQGQGRDLSPGRDRNPNRLFSTICGFCYTNLNFRDDVAMLTSSLIHEKSNPLRQTTDPRHTHTCFRHQQECQLHREAGSQQGKAHPRSHGIRFQYVLCIWRRLAG